ncbi:MAG: ribose 5-phosphate isomerase B [Bacillota bacterium]|nr:ribose 5-phosphate isomerase B [Bacillota bacterium]
MRVAMGSDHVGLELKKTLSADLEALGHTALDCGCYQAGSTDYPVWGAAVGQAVAEGRADLGVVVCGTGIGIGIAAGRVPGVRVATVSEPYSAVLGRQHNNANVLAIGARVVGVEVARRIMKVFLEAEFEGGRHQRRVDQLEALARDPHALDGLRPNTEACSE